jgi:hypothetical protein
LPFPDPKIANNAKRRNVNVWKRRRERVATKQAAGLLTPRYPTGFRDRNSFSVSGTPVAHHVLGN